MRDKFIKRAVTFIIITFALNYLLAFVFFRLNGGDSKLALTLMGIIYMLVPMAVAMFLQKVVYHDSIKELGISWKLNKWWAIGWLLPAVIAFATLGVTLLIPGNQYSPDMAGMFDRYKDYLTPDQLAQMKQQISTMPVHPIWLALVQGLIAGFTVNALAAFGEEYGWRGYLQKYFGFLGFWRSSLLIGFIWGLWHAPLILQGHNYPQHPQLGVLMMTAWTMLLAPIFSYIRFRSKSVIAAAVCHGSINGIAGLSILVIKGGNDITTGITGLPGFIVLLAVNLLILLFDRFAAKEKVGSF